MEVKVHFLAPKPELYEGLRNFLSDWLESQEDVSLKETSIEVCQVVLLLGVGGQIAFMEEGDVNRFKSVLEALENFGKRIVLFSINTREDVADAFPSLIDCFIDKRLAPSEQASALAGFLRQCFE